MADKEKEADKSSEGFAPNSPPDLTKAEPGPKEHENEQAWNGPGEGHPPSDTGL